MKFEKIYLLFALLVVLGVLYIVNIFSIADIASSVVDKPVKLSFTVINPSKEQCEDCFDVETLIGIIKSSHNIKITNKKIVTPSDSGYSKLVKRYDVKNLPAIVVSGDTSNSKITGAWESLSGEDKKGDVLIQNLLPFYDIKEQKQKGFIDVVLLEDKTCSDCFEATQYLETLKRSAMTVKNYSVYDISSAEGRVYVDKYKIKKVPALLMSASADDYPGFRDAWKDVGTIESDGWFVFRKVEKTGGKFSEI